MAEYSVFGASVPDSVNENDNDDYSLGTVVNIGPTPNGGRIIRAKHYGTTTPPSGPIVWRVSTNDAELDLLGSHTFVSQTPGWIEEDLAVPIDIPPAGQNVVVWIGTPNRYVNTGTFFTSGAGSAGITNGPLTAPASAADPRGIGNGRFGGDSSSVPQGTISGGNYYVDLVFEDNPEPPNEGSAALALDLAVDAAGEAPEVPPNEGSAALGLGLLIAASGDAPSLPPNEGDAALSLLFELSGTGSTPPVIEPNEGSAALGLSLAVSAAGAAPLTPPNEGEAGLGISYSLSGIGFTPEAGPNEGSAALTLSLAVSAAGERESFGTAALGLVFTVAATGDNGAPFRCSPVRSFAEVMS